MTLCSDCLHRTVKKKNSNSGGGTRRHSDRGRRNGNGEDTVRPGDVTSNEWEQRRSNITLKTWDFRHTATTEQTEWHTSTAASSSGYGIVVEEMSDAARARASTTIGPTGGNENALRSDPRVVPDNMTKTARITVQEIDQDAETEKEKHTVEHLIEGIKKLEEQSKEMQQRIPRM